MVVTAYYPDPTIAGAYVSALVVLVLLDECQLSSVKMIPLFRYHNFVCRNIEMQKIDNSSNSVFLAPRTTNPTTFISAILILVFWRMCGRMLGLRYVAFIVFHLCLLLLVT